MKLCIIWNSADSTKSIYQCLRDNNVWYEDIQEHFLEVQSIPLLRREWLKLASQVIGKFDRVLLVGEKLANVILPSVTLKEDGKPSSMDTYHGTLYDIDGTIFVPTYLETNSVTLSYQKNDVYRWLTYDIPALPKVDTSGIYDLITYVYLDIETTGLDWKRDTITSVQVCIGNKVIYINSNILSFLKCLYDDIKSSNGVLVLHNALFDLSFISVLTNRNWFLLKVHDTMLISKARGNHHNSLKHLASIYNTKYHPLSYKEQGLFNKEYAVADVLATRELYLRWIDKGLRPIDYLSFEAMCTFGTARLNGMYVNRGVLSSVYDELKIKIHTLEQRLHDIAPIQWSNNNQVSKVLVDLKVSLTEKTKTGYSVSLDALNPFRSSYEVVDLLLQYREYNKLISTFYSTYAEGTKEEPYVYPTINILGADSGRTTCTNPNIQQLPLSVRRIFTSRFENGKIAVFDLDRSELVCAVMLSGDDVMGKALKEYDYHKYVAAIAFGTPYDEVTKEQRSTAKVLTFGALLYGGSAKGIAEQTGTDAVVVEKGVQNLRKGFKKLNEYQDKYTSMGLTHLRIIDAFGKVRDLRFVNEQKFGAGSVKRAALNTPIQGLSCYVCLILCNSIFKQFVERKLKSLLVTQVHDEVVIDVHPDEIDQVKGIVEDAFNALDTHPVLRALAGYGIVKPSGDLVFGDSWYDAKVG